MKYRSTIVIVLVIALLGAIFTFAEGSVPGNTFYKVKISISEPLAGMFAFSEEEKTEWEERLVERRLKEAEKLALSNNLNEPIRIAIENSIKIQIEKFKFNLKDLKPEKDSKESSSDLNLRLQAALNAYQNILTKITEKTSVDEDTKNEVTTLLSTLKGFEVEVSDSQTNIESSFMKNSQSDSIIENAPTVALASMQEKQKTLEDALYATKLLYQKNKLRLYGNAPNEISAKLAQIENLISEIKSLDNLKDFVIINEKFQLGLNLIDEIKVSILSNLIQEDTNHRGELDDEGEHKSDNEDKKFDD